MKTLDPKILERSKGWLRDVFFPCAKGKSLAAEDPLLVTLVTPGDLSSDLLAAACKTLYRQIVDRKFDDSDVQFEDIMKYVYNYKDQTTKDRTEIQMIPEFVANALAWMCKVNEIYWDDTSTTSYRVDYFKKSYLGKALWDFECFATQYTTSSSGSTTSSTSTSSSTTSSTSTSNTPKKPSTSTTSGSGKYKNRGQLSSVARDMISKPGDKFTVKGTDVFFIRDKVTPSKKPIRAYIKPVTPNAEINGTNKVFVGNSNNWGDITCFFETQAEATEFMQKIVNSGAYSGPLDVVSKKAESNGYFAINTNLGKCIIRAFDLNEEVEDVIEESLEISPEEAAKKMFERFYEFLD